MKVDAVAGGIGDPSQPAHPGLDEGLRIFPPGLWHLAVAAGTSSTARPTLGVLSQFHSERLAFEVPLRQNVRGWGSNSDQISVHSKPRLKPMSCW
jgi:hypothetical protein